MNQVDYTVEGFTIPVIRDNVKGYASINREMYRDEDGLDTTGHYLVYLLHPQGGSTYFELEPDNSYHGWKKVGGSIWVDDEIVQNIINAVEEWQKNPSEFLKGLDKANL